MKEILTGAFWRSVWWYWGHPGVSAPAPEPRVATPEKAAAPELCCVCERAPAVYRNYKDQPFCWPCACGERETVHAVPGPDDEVTPCCGRRMYQLPGHERMTMDADAVTCRQRDDCPHCHDAVFDLEAHLTWCTDAPVPVPRGTLNRLTQVARWAASCRGRYGPEVALIYPVADRALAELDEAGLLDQLRED
ncbi:hypothetical protein [Streptomyces sp. NPDC059009]|uniref:hypothetical protein n=1 Tax=Streptomyces sp. NPDC059009 TaxID=3346694 RepID=UPI0036BC137C